MSTIDHEFNHERVEVFRDAETGVTGVIAVHSTVLGPAVGGLRLAPYPGVDAAMVDALQLASAMTLKNSAAGLDLGGGKGVLVDDGAWADPAVRRARMRAVGRFVVRLAGDYITAEDVGTSPEDMVTIGERTSWVAGQPKQHGGSGDPSPVTARTVFAAIAAAARVRLKAPTLEGIRVGVIGVGHVGRSLVELLCAAGAHVLLTDIDAGRATEVAMLHGAHVRPLEGFLESDLDVLAPCALGGAIRQEDITHLRCAIVAGAANNPLRDPGRTAPELARAGILYVPDFLANCGGIIYVGGQILGYEAARVESLIEAAIERTEAVLTTAMASDRVPQDLAVEQALARLRRDEPPPSA